MSWSPRFLRGGLGGGLDAFQVGRAHLALITVAGTRSAMLPLMPFQPLVPLCWVVIP